MKREIGSGVRLTVAGAVYAGAVVSAIGAGALQSRLPLGFTVSIGIAVFVWCLLAYFPARILHLRLGPSPIGEAPNCPACGYNLTRNTSGVCPECGSRIVWITPLRARASRRVVLAVAVVLAAAVGALLGGSFVRTLSGRAERTVASSEDFEVIPEGGCFARWKDPDLRELEPYAVFAIIDNRVFARFTFADAARSALVSSALSDPQQRVAHRVDWQAGTYSVDVYDSDDTSPSAQPLATHLDRDGDGIVETRIDWTTGTWYCWKPQPQWTLCPTGGVDSTQDGPE